MATDAGAADPALRAALAAMAAADRTLRARLAAAGKAFDGYHPAMADLHRRHAARLGAIVDARGWPGRSLAGDDGAEAAWLVLQHAIGDPALMRRCLPLLETAVRRGEAPRWQLAFLIDRVRTLEGRPQVYGTQHDWDAQGELSPLPLEDPPGVDRRRAEAGLEPLAERTRRLRAEERRSPADPDARRRGMESWAQATGWREP